MSGTTVYAVASGKGGVGKTTTTVNLGTALAGAGKRVAIVDADLGMANLAGFVSLSPDGATLHDVLAGDADVPDATYEVADGIAAIPSGTELEAFADTDATGLGEAIDRLRGEFDYVLLDVGAGVSHESVLPLGIADEVLLISTPEPASVQDVRKTIDLVDRAGGSVAGLVVTRGRPDSGVSHEEIASKLGVDLLGSIPEDPTARDSVYAGTPLVVHEPDAPASTAYRQLAATLADDVDVSVPDADSAAGADEESDDAAEPAADADESTEELDDDDADPDVAKADPDDAEADPDDAEADPDDAEADPDDAEADPDDAEADPDDAEADPDDAEAGPDEEAEVDGVAAAESAAELDADPAAEATDEPEPADPDEPASETSVEDAISEVDVDADDEAGDAAEVEAASEPEGAVAVGGDGSTVREAEADEVEGAVTIPDAEADSEAESDDESGDPVELDDEAIPFSGDDADAAASDGDDAVDSAETDDDDDETDDADAGDADDDEPDDEDGGFLGGIF